jgi:hypothetical protein
MTIRYADVRPWGRNFDEYRRMFALSDADLDRCILGCADGPAGFNAAMRRQGKTVLSADPLYQWSAEEIAQRIDQAFDDVLAQTRANQDRFLWREFPTPEALGEARMAAMRDFLQDYETGRQEGRYVCASLPALPFPDRCFDLALCSHFLFLYADNLSLQFHVHCVRELMRVAGETRIFPLLDANARPCAYLDAVLSYCATNKWTARVLTVPYQFQKGGDQMLQITRP